MSILLFFMGFIVGIFILYYIIRFTEKITYSPIVMVSITLIYSILFSILMISCFNYLLLPCSFNRETTTECLQTKVDKLTKETDELNKLRFLKSVTIDSLDIQIEKQQKLVNELSSRLSLTNR